MLVYFPLKIEKRKANNTLLYGVQQRTLLNIHMFFKNPSGLHEVFQAFLLSGQYQGITKIAFLYFLVIKAIPIFGCDQFKVINLPIDIGIQCD